jgi:thiosulfate/3-mercaptopyruvate sulfurtransferase
VDARPSRAEFDAAHVAGAVHVDLERDLAGDASHPERGGRHPLPTAAAFAAVLGRLGITPATRVIVYDAQGGANAAARLWWMLRAAGHDDVAVLDGGLAAARGAGVLIDAARVDFASAPAYPFTRFEWPTVEIDEVARRAADPSYVVVDARAPARYRGETEPIDPVAGHVPGAVNAFFGENLDASGRFLAPDAVREKYAALLAGRAPERLVAYCGSGVTACHTLLALDHAGLGGAALYVGSWGEWCRTGRPRAP